MKSLLTFIALVFFVGIARAQYTSVTIINNNTAYPAIYLQFWGAPSGAPPCILGPACVMANISSGASITFTPTSLAWAPSPVPANLNHLALMVPFGGAYDAYRNSLCFPTPIPPALAFPLPLTPVTLNTTLFEPMPGTLILTIL